jgi:tRNA(Leu) C34 or U34 (ribose-2'-O)-methylase TrmL
MERGFACIGLDSPKFPENVGAVLRAAYCYNVAQVNIARCRSRDLGFKNNTPQGHRHIPTFIVNDPLEYRPHDTQVVAVDLVDGAVPLPLFDHPERALYVFGAEDATLGRRILDRAQHRVMIPTRSCMNLAATVNVVLYDRLSKGREFGQPYRQRPQIYHAPAA